MSTEFKSLPSNIQVRMKQYRNELLAFGMREPTKREALSCHWYFYKPITELTAFVLNLEGTQFNIGVTYGYASTAFTRMAGDENALTEWGVSDNDINLREKIIIFDESSVSIAKSKIETMYTSHFFTTKDDLLLCAREKRKAFIQQINARLKPIGFKKKANTWACPLGDTYYLMFNAQKSSFSDEYYFNIYIGKNGTNYYGDCYETRVAPNGMYPLDWQALTNDEFDSFLDKTVVPELKKIIGTYLTELGKIPSYWTGCQCNHKKCESCWMKKNLWESNLE